MSSEDLPVNKLIVKTCVCLVDIDFLIVWVYDTESFRVFGVEWKYVGELGNTIKFRWGR